MSIEIRNSLDELHPKVKELAERLIEEARKEGINLGISETYRTPERQDYLYAQGRTRPGNIVTNARGAAMSSYHQWGLAFDVFNNVPGDAYNINVLNRVGEIGENLGLEWGGRWANFPDRPHFQYTFGLSIADLNAGKRPPDYSVPAPTTTYANSVQKLASKGIINSPDFWLNLTKVHVSNTELLILKLARHFNPVISSHEAAVKELINQGIIGTPAVWLDTSRFSVNNIKSLIIKTAQAL